MIGVSSTSYCVEAAQRSQRLDETDLIVDGGACSFCFPQAMVPVDEMMRDEECGVDECERAT
jgi:hypothetical protein